MREGPGCKDCSMWTSLHNNQKSGKNKEYSRKCNATDSLSVSTNEEEDESAQSQLVCVARVSSVNNNYASELKLTHCVSQ